MGGGKGGSKSQTTRIEPWSGAQGALRDVVTQAQQLYQNGGFSPAQFTGSGIANPGATTQAAQQNLINQANNGMQSTTAAQGSLAGMLSGQQQYQDLQGVRDNILSSAIPAAVSQFAGNGMTNSSVAMDGVGSAAASALAPFEYDAYNQQQNRALQAANLAPTLDRAQYMPGQILSGVGQQQDALSQAQLTDRINRYNQGQNQDLNNFNGYLQAITGLSGLGQTQTAQTPGMSTGGQIASAGLGGLGAYGALAANPITAPFAIGGGLLAGLGGLF